MDLLPSHCLSGRPSDDVVRAALPQAGERDPWKGHQSQQPPFRVEHIGNRTPRSGRRRRCRSGPACASSPMASSAAIPATASSSPSSATSTRPWFPPTSRGPRWFRAGACSPRPACARSLAKPNEGCAQLSRHSRPPDGQEIPEGPGRRRHQHSPGRCRLEPQTPVGLAEGFYPPLSERDDFNLSDTTADRSGMKSGFFPCD